MASWYLYSDDGQHLGPVPTEYVARAVKSGAVPKDRWVTESDRNAWRPVSEVAEIAALVEAMSAPPRARDHETTMIANTDAFPSFMPAPSTQKDVPSSDTLGESSERTLIEPAAFEREMARMQGPAIRPGGRAPAAGMPAGSGPQGASPPLPVGSDFEDETTVRSNNSPHDPFGSTLRSPDVPAGIVPRPVPAVSERTSGAPLVPARAPSQSASPPRAETPTTPPRASAPSQRGGSGIVFFLGGLALGAIFVVALLVWAFKGGLLSR